MDFFELTLLSCILLFVAALVAGFVDTLVGGGGLITIPALLMAGVPPITTLGTNKIQAVFGSGTASFLMFKHKRVLFQTIKLAMLTAFIGSLIGAVVVQFFNPAFLQWLIPLVVGLIALYFLFAPNINDADREPKITESSYRNKAVSTIGFYDGMLGPGTGSFFVLAGVALRGQDILQSTANAKALNFATNLAAVFVFIAAGKVLWMVGALMMVGQAIGAHLGAHTLFKINPNILKYLVVAMCVIMLIAFFIKL